MNRQADPLLLQWLMLPATDADAGRLPARCATEGVRAVRVASRQLLQPMRSIGALRRGDDGELVTWLRRDLSSLRWSLHLAGAWVYASKLRMQAGQAVTRLLTCMLGTPQLLAVFRSDDSCQVPLAPLRDVKDVLAAGGALMHSYCQKRAPMFAHRLELRFSADESAAWREASQAWDEGWRDGVAMRVLQARPEVRT